MGSDAEQLQLNLENFETWVKGGKTPEQAALSLSKYVGESTAEEVLEEYKKRIQKFITLRDPTLLKGNRHIQTWYYGPDFQGAWCWPAYKSLLVSKSWPTTVIESLDDASSKIMAHLPHPSEPSIQTRGLVVGYVQSGKTANFTGLIAKAADAGYKLFIVLAGMTSSLRRQTQRRLEAELKDASKDTAKNWFLLTDRNQDFRGMALGNPNALLNPENIKMRIMCVVKKNTHILRRLKEFLENADEAVLSNCPVLIIDDEADQASINTKRKAQDRSAINKRIVELLGVLPKAAYVGYTATPFANLFIDPALPKDLYPRDFIFDLPQPSAYFGAERIFGRETLLAEEEPNGHDSGLDVIRDVPEEEVPLVRCKGAKGRFEFEPELAPSLEEAINYYLLATAERLAREHEAHCSMLVHTTLYVYTHEQLRKLVADHVDTFANKLKKSAGSFVAELRQLWEREHDLVPASKFDFKMRQPTFEEVVERLDEVLERCAVVVDNGRLDGLDYTLQEGEQHKIFIAIGGNTLSRGLTLEGLMVSYFVRTAGAYDTLLQMGRWFGYRLGYEDLPRVWMTEDLRDSFYHLATVEAEIRQDIRRYEKEGISPLEFGVRVRTHPKLAITSKMKMQSAKLTRASFSDKHPQTFLFRHDDAETLGHNLNVARSLLSGLNTASAEKDRWLFRDVQVERVLDFLRDYYVVPEHADLQFDLLKKYIETELNAGSLRLWNVGVFGNVKGAPIDLGLGELGCVSRSRFLHTEPANIRGLTSPRDRTADLNVEVKGTVSNKRRIELRQQHAPNHGLLMLYPIDKDSEPRKNAKQRHKLEAHEHVMGMGLVFPTSVVDQQNYVTNDFEFLRAGEGLDEHVEEEADIETLITDQDENEQDG